MRKETDVVNRDMQSNEGNETWTERQKNGREPLKKKEKKKRASTFGAQVPCRRRIFLPGYVLCVRKISTARAASAIWHAMACHWDSGNIMDFVVFE